MSRFLPVILGGIVVMVLVIGYMIKDVVRDWLIIPILEAIRVADFNQGIVWIAFLIVILIFTVLKIIQNFRLIPVELIRIQRPEGNSEEPIGQLESIVQLITLSREGAYSNRRLAQYVARVLLDILAYQHRTSPEKVMNSLRQGRLSLPEEIEAYMKAALFYQPIALSFTDRWFFWRKSPKTILDSEFENMIRFLELQLNTNPPNAASNLTND